MRWRRRLRRVLMGPSVIVLLSAAVALNPSVLFAHELTVENVTLHAREPLPPEAQAILSRARARAARSPYFDPADHYDLYLCDTPKCFAFFVPWKPDVGGVSITALSGTIFLREAHVARDRLISPTGAEVPGVRTLTYFFAHELTHTAMARSLGRLAYHRLEPWQQEGIADVIGKGGEFDFEAERQRFLAGDPSLDPSASGLYLRYQLEVEALLRRGHTLEEIVSKKWEVAAIDSDLRRD